VKFLVQFNRGWSSLRFEFISLLSIGDNSLIQGKVVGVDAMGYQLSHKCNKTTSIMRDKQSYSYIYIYIYIWDNLDPGTASYLSFKWQNSHGQGARVEIERGHKES
jgi:hypothetical protein